MWKFWKEIPERRRVRLKLRVFVITAAAVFAFLLAMDLEEGRFGRAAFYGVVLLALSLAEFVLVDIAVDARFPKQTSQLLERLTARLAATPTHDEIVKALERCTRKFMDCDIEAISATLHFVVDIYSDSESSVHKGLVQLSDYAGSARGRRGRVLHASKGIVGRCVRRNELVHVNFADDTEYRERMVSEFGFTRRESEKHTTTARSYLAYPLRNDEVEPVAVLYFFSTEPNVFPQAANEGELRDTADEITGLLRAAEILP